MTQPEKNSGRSIGIVEFLINPNLGFYRLPEAPGIDLVHSQTAEEFFTATALAQGLGAINMKRDKVVIGGAIKIVHTYLTFDLGKWEVQLLSGKRDQKNKIREIEHEGWTGCPAGSRIIAYRAKV